MGMTRRRMLAIPLVVALALTGCDFVFTPSLGTVCQAVSDDDLVGVWERASDASDPFASSEGADRLHVSRDGQGYSVQLTQRGEVWRTYHVRLYRVGSLTLAETASLDEELKETGDSTVTLTAVARRGDTLGLRHLSASWADDHLVANRRLSGCTVRCDAETLVEAIEDSELSAFGARSVLYVKRGPERD